MSACLVRDNRHTSSSRTESRYTPLRASPQCTQSLAGSPLASVLRDSALAPQSVASRCPAPVPKRQLAAPGLLAKPSRNNAMGRRRG